MAEPVYEIWICPECGAQKTKDTQWLGETPTYCLHHEDEPGRKTRPQHVKRRAVLIEAEPRWSLLGRGEEFMADVSGPGVADGHVIGVVQVPTISCPNCNEGDSGCVCCGDLRVIAAGGANDA